MKKIEKSGYTSGYTSEGTKCNQNAFAKRLKSAREKAGFSQKLLAEKVGVSTFSIQEYERGNLPKGDNLYSLSEVLGCSIDWLLKGESAGGGGQKSKENACSSKFDINGKKSTRPVRLLSHPDVGKVIERMIDALGAPGIEELSQTIGVTTGAIHSAKKRREVPLEWLHFISDRAEVSVDWLLYGDDGRDEQFQIDPNLQYYKEYKADNNWKISDLLAKTAEVLESETVYKDALAANVVAFHQAVTAEQKMAQMEQAMLSIEHRLSRLEEENRQLRLQLQGADDDHPGAKAANSD